jgi:DNA polymerase III epsilon subunit-like protein
LYFILVIPYTVFIGARWDTDKKKWFLPMGKEEAPFKKWMKVYLTVPFAEKEEAKKLGAVWDQETQKWFIRGSTDQSLFKKWLLVGDALSLSPTMSAKQPLPSAKASRSSAAASRSSSTTPRSTSVEVPHPYAIIDIDTTGLPVQVKGKYDKFTSLASYNPARIVKLSYVTCNPQNMDLISKKSWIIKSDGFAINNTEYHGINHQVSEKDGIPFSSVGQEFIQSIKDSKNLIFHNAEFCLNILKSEFYRYGLFKELELLQTIKPICIMERTKSIMGLLDVAERPKVPSLKELLSLTLKEDLPEQHTSDMDVEYIRRLLKEWTTQGKLQLEEKSEKKKEA